MRPAAAASVTSPAVVAAHQIQHCGRVKVKRPTRDSATTDTAAMPSAALRWTTSTGSLMPPK